MRTRIIVWIVIFASISSYAQQDAQFTQYMYNTISVNPAYAGSRGAMSIFGLYRTQWIGLDGAPETSSFSLNTPLNNTNLGLGVSLLSDKIGPTNETGLSVDLSYTVPTSETFKLSFGIKGTANLFNLDIDKLNPENQGDPQFQGLNSKISPNIGAGVYWHSDKAYVGLSIPNFIETNRYSDNDVAIYKDKINYYFIAGYVIDIEPSIKFKPALLTKMVKGAPLQVDLSGNFMFNDKFVVGLAYRWSAAVSVLAGFQITDGLYIGYGYDHETTSLRRFNSGSHEIFLRFEFLNKYSRITSPRFF
ncbi:type IX secretion system membrane protein PorP/SprF [Flavobacterium sp. Fl-77]|uniref:Type IX secretion system membrane protein PorP/SprF n=1 Tax=Flavobacterium flavipigmentatum TaxID=2893884 RepID=A0AAJ2SF88_9FLAO|nr:MULTISPECIES: type IX secretion system membrane protein PorP/SprF [unclassified Flavobacterium]MDX6183174.1 type IX secretion system membrane protein PorP/SprF [Flavobacterium sp. Fl-33]MDX6186757.1 type IX secretion system membrane protein PorP/SprF [Flavobacterium sp. Fl-77]UFH40411.1 type IX secretion system membrane protein PorP/SprF [Flavobacterium sp. F-70]